MFTQYLMVIGFFIVAISIFAFGLHFSNYKKRGKSGCCGGGNCEKDGGTNTNSCYSEKASFVDNYGK